MMRAVIILVGWLSIYFYYILQCSAISILRPKVFKSEDFSDPTEAIQLGSLDSLGKRLPY